MASFFEAILNFLLMIGTVVTNFVSGILQLIAMLPSAISMLSYSIGMMPPVLIVFATAFISVSIVYVVIGR